MPKKTHIKPSKEELKKNIDKITEEVETGMQEEEKEVEEIVERIEEAEKPIKLIKPDTIEYIEPEAVEEEPEKEEVEPSKELKDALKVEVKEKTEKLSASARENQKIYAKNRILNQAITSDIPEPTEEELQQKYQDWDIMSDVERKFAKETVLSERWRAKIKDASDQATKIEKWNESVVDYAEDPKTLADNPELEGKTEEFKQFAQQETNNSVPFNILVSAFLHENSKGKVENKGKMFETGSGGRNEKPNMDAGKISIEDAIKLRETNYDKYKELVKLGKIASDL